MLPASDAADGWDHGRRFPPHRPDARPGPRAQRAGDRGGDDLLSAGSAGAAGGVRQGEKQDTEAPLRRPGAAGQRLFPRVAGDARYQFFRHRRGPLYQRMGA